MNAADGLGQRFEAHRDRLWAVAYRMLGSSAEAEDAVQEAWLRFSRADTGGVDNLAGWLTTVVGRVCLDMLRARTTRRERLAGAWLSELGEPVAYAGRGPDPEREAELADSVGRALLVVLDTLSPAERVAFVLHDAFAVPFDEIARIVSRSPAAAKKLGGRARRKVRAGAEGHRAALAAHRRVVAAVLDAVRAGDIDGLLRILAPDVVRRADPAALPAGAAVEVRGADEVIKDVTRSRRRARYAEPALVNGGVGVVVAPRGRLAYALTFTIRAGLIAGYEVIADPARLRRLTLALLDD